MLCFHVTLQGSSLRLVLMVLAAGTGGTLQYGYNLAIMNAPTTVCLCLVFFMLIRNILPGTECVHTYTCSAGYTSLFF